MRNKRFVRHIVVVIAVVFLLCVAWTLFFAGRLIVVSGDSMYPTYSNGQYILVNRVSDETDIPENNPVCWVHLPNGSNVIKRLIGYPGDVIELVDGDTYRNGNLLMRRSTNSWDNQIFTLGANEYLFLGDNRANSLDGRMWDFSVGIENIYGVVPDSGYVS